MSQDAWPLGVEPGQEVEIDVFRPQDAPGVVALFKAVYGDGYPVDLYYQAEALLRANESGRLISIVACTPRREVVGHIALFNSSPNPKLFELGAGAVLPSYRRSARGLTRMMSYGPQAAAARFGLQAVFGDPVCTHVYSQKICKALGWVTHALELDLMPAGLYDPAAEPGERISATMDFITLAPDPHTVFLPPGYADIFRFLYQGLDDQRQMETSDRPLPRGLTTRISSKLYEVSQLARLAVGEIGTDWAAAFLREEEAALAQGAQVIQVWLPLNRPWIGPAIDILRQRGYFLGGLLPRWFGHDGLLMQRLAQPPHWGNIQLEYARAQTLLGLVREDWQAVGQAR
ncbi:MAG: hypothetical protein KQJ78_21175 [Deltaproteobacteria bacterium]|nr:hypothetical protein [Deltaproteobacteria bacterium]